MFTLAMLTMEQLLRNWSNTSTVVDPSTGDYISTSFYYHSFMSLFRATILCNKYDGHPKGFAYVEFTDKDSVQTAMALDDSLFRGRQIKV